MIVAVLAFYRLTRNFSPEEQSPTVVVQDSINKLKLEFPKTPTPAPEFALKDPAGKQVSVRDLRGKVVFLNFWATWCLPCIEEMPAMEKLHQELEKEGLVILAVNFQEDPERVKEFFDETRSHIYGAAGPRWKGLRAISSVGPSGERHYNKGGE